MSEQRATAPDPDQGGILRPDDWDDPIRIPDLPPLAHILVPFDGSHAAELALAWAERAAAPTAAEIIVLVTYEPPLTKKGRGATYADALRSALAEEAHELATEATELLAGRGSRTRGVVVRGEPAAAVRQVVADDQVDLVVVGRRGLSSELGGLPGAVERLRDTVGGAVAERAVRSLEVPVLVVG